MPITPDELTGPSPAQVAHMIAEVRRAMAASRTAIQYCDEVLAGLEDLARAQADKPQAKPPEPPAPTTTPGAGLPSPARAAGL